MAKIILAICLLVCVITNGQFIKGEKFVGGNLNLFHQEDSNGTNPSLNTTDFSASPRIGFQLSDKLAVGTGIGIGSSSRRYDYITTLTNSSGATVYNELLQENSSDYISIDIFGKRYFVITENFLFSLDGNLSFMRIHSIANSYNLSAGSSTQNEKSI